MNLRRVVLFVLAVGALALAGGCFSWRRELPRPGRTELDGPIVTVPATTVGNYLVVEAKWDKRGPYRFLIDTGAAVTLVTPELAARYVAKNAPLTATPLVRVRSAEGETALLPSTTLRRIQLGGARFEDVQALVYDCAALSAHLGLKIDGVLGFPLFRETLLTLDYPQSRIVLQPRSAASLVPGTPIAFNNDRKTPIIPLRIGDETFIALIDSGSDADLSLNPVGLKPDFAVPPRDGGTITTINGDHLERIGRLAVPLRFGDYTVDQPVVDLTDSLSSVGGGVLRHFTVTFDQEHSKVTFYRDSHAPVAPAPRRSAGLSFSKTPAYWRVASVVPGSPAETDGVEAGDLITRINGEPVSAWNLQRYQGLIATADAITFTFLNGTREDPQTVRIFELVP